MRMLRWLLSLMIGLGTAGLLFAQPPFFIPPGHLGVQGNGLSINYQRISRHSAFGLHFNSGYSAYYGGFPGYRPFGSSFTQIVVYSPPPLLVAPPPPLALLVDPAPRQRIPPRDLDEQPPAEKPVPGQDRGVFRPLDRDNRARAQKPIPPAPPPPAPEKPKPEAKAKEKEPIFPPLPRAPQPDPDPVVEQARLLTLGRAAFARQMYGLSAEHFQQAINVAPQAPLPYFLLAQAQMALGKYRLAVESIFAGLAREPEWPRVAWQPLQLYGANVADYSEHLQQLEGARQAHPNDPYLLFLYGYHLWFDGRQVEALPDLERAAPAFPGKGVDKFLNVLPAAQVV